MVIAAILAAMGGSIDGCSSGDSGNGDNGSIIGSGGSNRLPYFKVLVTFIYTSKVIYAIFSYANCMCDDPKNLLKAVMLFCWSRCPRNRLKR